jgi:hypothetical protein
MAFGTYHGASVNINALQVYRKNIDMIDTTRHSSGNIVRIHTVSLPVPLMDMQHNIKVVVHIFFLLSQ